MIKVQEIRGEEVHMYSIGQVAQRLERHAGSLRRLEKDGVIPQAFVRFENNYRAYTEHERNVLVFLFQKYDIRQGKALGEDFKKDLIDSFNQIHEYYREQADELPEGATNAKTTRSPFRN